MISGEGRGKATLNRVVRKGLHEELVVETKCKGWEKSKYLKCQGKIVLEGLSPEGERDPLTGSEARV